MAYACFTLFHQVYCDLQPMINIIDDNNVYNLDLQLVQEKECSNDLSWKHQIKWDLVDPEKSPHLS